MAPSPSPLCSAPHPACIYLSPTPGSFWFGTMRFAVFGIGIVPVYDTLRFSGGVRRCWRSAGEEEGKRGRGRTGREGFRTSPPSLSPSFNFSGHDDQVT